MSDEEWANIRTKLRKEYLYKKENSTYTSDYIRSGLSEYNVSLLIYNRERQCVTIHLINEFRITNYVDFSMEEFEKRFDKVERIENGTANT